MGRIEARDIIFKLTFELCFQKAEDSSSYENFLSDNKLDNENTEFVKNMYTGIVQNYDEIIAIIAKNISGYTIDRLFKVDLAILIMAVYELMYYKQTPPTVVANEAVELAKKYSTEKSYAFINAVIAKIIK